MQMLYLMFFVTLVPVLSGVSGCDSRTKFGLYEYELAECPKETFSLPTQMISGEWGFNSKSPPRSCDGFSYYRMADEKYRSGGGFGMPSKAAEFYIKLVRQKSCSVFIAFSFDEIAEPDFRKRIDSYSALAVDILLRDSGTKARMPAKSFEILAKKDDFENWCKERKQ